MGDLAEGTLADVLQLMSKPPWPRRGVYEAVTLANPGAGNPLNVTVPGQWWQRFVSLTFTYTASSAAGTRVPVINILNADGTLLNQTPAAPAVQPSEAWLVSADLSGSPAIGTGVTVQDSGSVTGPTALQVITSGALTAGEWVIQWLVSLGGTTAAAEVNNFGLYLGSAQEEVSVNPQTVSVLYPQPPVTVEVPAAGATLAIEAIGAGTSTATYRASFSALMASSAASYPQLPDLTLRSGWQLQVTVPSMPAGDTITGITAIRESYPSNWADGTLRYDTEAVVRQAVRELLGGPNGIA